MSKLKNNRSGLLNPLTLLKFITIIIIFHETDYSIIFNEDPYYIGSTGEYFIFLVTFILSLESKICQTIALLFSLSYGLIRLGKYEGMNAISGSIRIICLHCFIQVGLIMEFLQKQPQLDRSNSQLVALGMLGRQFNYSTIPNSHRQQIQARNHLQLYGDMANQQNPENQIEPDVDTESNPTHLDQFYENVLNNLECGIYQLENVLLPVKTINPFMSHIVLREDHLSEDYLNCQLHDFNLQIDSQIQIWPKFNRSKDIQQFQNFIPTLDATKLNFENRNNGLKEIQMHIQNMLLKTIIENLLAFMHFKYIKTQNLIDFSLKIFVKKDNLSTSIVLSPILIKQKPQIIMFILDLTDGPIIQQLNLSHKNTDLLISDISQKIKQPLNCTISMLEITINQASKEVQEEFLNPALAGCKLLINHANDILDYVTLKNKGHLELQQLDVHLKDFLLDAITIVQTQAIFRGLKIHLHIRQNVPQFIRTDPNRLRQIISNLLTTIIQATIQGKIEILAQTSVNQIDHIEILIKVMATETNFQTLQVIDKTVRYFKQLQLKNSPVIDLASAGRKFSQSIIIAFYLSLNLSSVPFDYNYERIEQKEYFNFLILVKNNNPKFQSLLSVKRQSALITFQQSIRQQLGQLSAPLRHQSTKFSSFSPNSQQSFNTSKFAFANHSFQKQVEENTKNIKQDMQYVSEEQEDSQQDNSESSNDSENEIELQLDKIVNKDPQFMDFVNEDNKQLPVLQELQQNSRDSILTFGGRSSLYSSIRYSSSTMQPNDLIDCFEKMEKIKHQKFAQQCECSKIFISEINDYDLYALSHQLQNIGITYEFTMQRNSTLEKIGSCYASEKNCCRGLCLIFIAVDEIDDELINICNQIKELNNKHKKDLRIVALVGLQDDEFRKQIKKLPFHDFLSKPIMIDALLFILAKWVKL